MEDSRTAPAAKPTITNPKLLLWILMIVYVLNFLDRQIVNILAEPISRDLDLSDTQIGLLTGLAFALFYTLLGIPIARYADNSRTNRVGLISISLAVWSAMTALCGLAQNFAQLALARVGVGVGEAGCTPAAHSLITDSVPPEKRSSAIAFYGLGIPIGSLLGYFATDWRVAILLLFVPTALNAAYYGPTYATVQGLVKPEARAIAAALMLFAQNLIGLGLGPLLFGMMSDAFKPLAGDESVRWVLYGAAWLGLIPAFFFWRASLRLNAELKSG